MTITGKVKQALDYLERVDTSYERQNALITDYLVPIITFDLGKIPENYRRNQRQVSRNEMREIIQDLYQNEEQILRDSEKAGVFESLDRLENDGRSIDNVIFGTREQANASYRLGGSAEMLKPDFDDRLYNSPIFNLIIDKTEHNLFKITLPSLELRNGLCSESSRYA